ncbi:adhesion G-protein coupled receptor G2-like isoform X21 [Pristis pectinata]|uniref:adhesion G-protein coupled receptor G2-like isoform X20 n=1 Tax=Pristis pectinata TaxID=685728 RepID=UPI00223D3823|nr:adhesion G-protein coupled receptor G2-like isoform X20 [Pristis pectinata]XP_051870894.1 adhesion G-protein coupled receptor G2-like isoform X21 [Pristis pectinata]
MVPCRGQCYISSRWMLPKARICFFPAALFILVSVLQVPSATSTSLKGQKAVFHPRRANEYGTLSPGTKIPPLKAFTLCVDIRLRKNSENGVAVFTYNTDTWPKPSSSMHELSIMVRKKDLLISMFGRKIDVKVTLPLYRWHSLCLTWNDQSERAHIYVNKILVHSKKLGKKMLGQNGSLVLGRKHKRIADRLQVDLEMAFVGDLYLFRLWDFEKDRQSISGLNCEDGTIITWDSEQWDFMGTILERDTTLICCEQFVKLRFKHSEYEHYGARISRRLLADDSTDSFNTTVSSNTSTVAPTTSATTADDSTHSFNTTVSSNTSTFVPTTSATTESSTLNMMSSPKSTTGFTTRNDNGSVRTLETSTLNVTSAPSTTTENSTLIMTLTSLNTTETSTLNVTSSPPNTTETSTLNVTSSPPNTTDNNTLTVMSSTQNTTGNSTLTMTLILHNATGKNKPKGTKFPKKTIGSSTPTVTTGPQKITVNSPTGMTSIQMNTTESPQETTNSLNITDLNESVVAAIVSQLDEFLQMEAIDAGLATRLIGTISTLLNASPDVVASFSTRLIQSVDMIGLKLNFTEESINITSSSLALAVSKINAIGFSGAEFSISDITNLQVSLGEGDPQESFAAIRLPSSLLNNLTSEDQERASRVQFTFYEKTTLFQDPGMENTSDLISYIIASSVANLSITNLMDPVQITFKNLETIESNFDVQCVFWDFSRNNGTGGWNSDGCRTVLKASNETVCECDHLTHFGILLVISRDFNIDEKNNQILTFITYIGCGLSSILLAVTLVTYLAFEKLRRDYPSKILINLCAALLFLNMTFLIDSWISGYRIEGLCIAVAVFLHYFLLVSFTWMSLEAFHMYLALVKVFNTYVHRYMLKFSIIGWGTPIIVIAIILIISPDNYGLGHYDKNTNSTSDIFCWINDDTVFYVAAVAYFCVMFLLNVSMFIVVMIQFCRIKNQKQHQNAERNILQDMKSVTGLTFLLGITWGFAFFAWAPVNIPFMYLFAIFNTLQGAFIFIFHCLAKENVQKQWRRYLCCGKLRLAENSDWSRTATNNTKKQQPLVQVMSLSSTSNNSLQSNSSLFLVQEYSSHPNVNGAKV